jgi:hypothetical protein
MRESGGKIGKVVIMVVIGAFLALGLSSGTAGARVVVGLGFPFPYPYAYYPYGYYPYGYYPRYPDTESQPPVYIEPEQPYYWYYCQDPQGYYPYVGSCPGGWTKVTPTPPPPEKEGLAR